MKPTRRVLFALMIAALSGVGACERSDGLGDLTGPTTQHDLIGDLIGTTDGLLGAGDGLLGAAGGVKPGQKVVALKRNNVQTGDQTYVSEPISRWGGTFKFGSHRLVIPAGAVLFPTRFSATVRAGEDIRVDLRAWNDLGTVSTFPIRVQLTINVADSNTDNLSGVGIYYLDPSGMTERMPTTVDPSGRNVTGYLNHFSDYIPGTLRNDSTAGNW